MNDGQPITPYTLALAPLTVLPAPPDAQIDAAHAAGYSHVGLRLNPVLPDDPRIMEDAGLRLAIRTKLRATGMGVLDIEVFRLEPGTDVAAMRPAIEFGAELGARHLLCTLGAIGPQAEGEEARMAALLAELATLCASFGVMPMLEFMAFRKMRTLDDALRLATLANHPNVGICVDALHLARSGGTPADLQRVPARMLPYMQLSDAPAAAPADLPREARFDRLDPGDGGLPLAALLQALPRGIALSLEVPSRARAAWQPRQRARAAATATRVLLARAGLAA